MPGGIRFEHLPDIAILTHPERLMQMQPWGNLVWENFAWQPKWGIRFQRRVPFSLWQRVFSEQSPYFVPDWGEQITLPFSRNDPRLQIFNRPHPTSDCLWLPPNKKPAYHTQIIQYTGHSGYSLRRWYSWSHASAFQCQSHPDTPVSKVTHCCFLYSHLTIQCALYQSSWCGFFNQGFLSGHRNCRVRKPYFLMTIDTNITSPQDFLY